MFSSVLSPTTPYPPYALNTLNTHTVALTWINNAEASASVCPAILVVVTCLLHPLALVVVTCLLHPLAEMDGVSEAYKCSCNRKGVWALPTSCTWMNTTTEYSSALQYQFKIYKTWTVRSLLANKCYCRGWNETYIWMDRNRTDIYWKVLKANMCTVTVCA